MGLASRLALVVAGLAAWRIAGLVEPYYLARPQLLVEPASLLWPPGALRAIAEILVIFILIWTAEALAIRCLRGERFRESMRSSLDGFVPLGLLLGFSPVLFPGSAPMALAWLGLDAGPWLVTGVVGCVTYRKWSFWKRRSATHAVDSAGRESRLAFTGFIVFLLVGFVVLAPERRFDQPYDERWGTGDEPRYVRITASLIHDGDVDIANAADHIASRVELASLPGNLSRALGRSAMTLAELAESALGEPPRGAPRHLGGPVVQGRGGGTYYVFLPGLPFLLAPAMILDSLLMPDRLYLTLFSGILIGVAAIAMTTLLVRPLVGTRRAAGALAILGAMSLPFFFYPSQLFTEAAAALCLGMMLYALMSPKIRRRHVLAFACGASLIIWLHTKYLPLWGICLAAMTARAWHSGLGEKASRRLVLLALTPPLAAMGAYCLFVFHITGSLMPDAIWVARGYPRGASFVSETTPSGLYYMFLDRSEGLFVYAPMYALALPGMLSLRRRSPATCWLLLAIAIPYLLSAASHDQGGAGGWSPPSRYAVPLLPVFLTAIAGYLGEARAHPLRWTAAGLVASASFWIALGMLAERNFPYDRVAFLASGVVDPTPALGTIFETQAFARRALYPVLLLAGLTLLWIWERREWTSDPLFLTTAILGLTLSGGFAAELASGPGGWVHPSQPAFNRIRADRPLYLALPDCGEAMPRLQFRGTEGSRRLSVSGAGFERELVVPSGSPPDVEAPVAPASRIRLDSIEPLRILRVLAPKGQRPFEVRGSCR